MNSTQTIDLKLEAVVLPVADAERSKKFYGGLGWRLDADFVVGDAFRAIQFTPPGSPCSIHFGKGLTSGVPGSVGPLFLIVSDIEAARAALVARGVAVSTAFHHAGPGQPRQEGRDPERHSYASYATFSDPDGNGWLLQEVTQRLPGRVDTNTTTFTSAAEIAGALRRAGMAHGDHEKKIGGPDTNWADWYADYIFKEQTGQPLPS